MTRDGDLAFDLTLFKLGYKFQYLQSQYDYT